MHHLLDLLLILQDVGLHRTDFVLLVSDLLLQLRQLSLQGLHRTVCDAGEDDSVSSVLSVPLTPAPSQQQQREGFKCQTPRDEWYDQHHSQLPGLEYNPA